MYAGLLLLALVCMASAQSFQPPGSELGPTYTLQTKITTIPNNVYDRMVIENRTSGYGMYSMNYDETHYEWENYDGWFNNPAHPEWGGAGKCAAYMQCHNIASIMYYFLADFPMERKTPVVYEDGVYEVIDESRRGNVLVISNLTQHGLSGLGSARRTAFFIFFGELVGIISI